MKQFEKFIYFVAVAVSGCTAKQSSDIKSHITINMAGKNYTDTLPRLGNKLNVIENSRTEKNINFIASVTPITINGEKTLSIIFDEPTKTFPFRLVLNGREIGDTSSITNYFAQVNNDTVSYKVSNLRIEKASGNLTKFYFDAMLGDKPQRISGEVFLVDTLIASIR